MIYLFTQNLIPEEIVTSSLKQVISELDECARMIKTPQMEENVTQFVEFLSESVKLLPKDSSLIRNLIKNSLNKILETPKAELQCLNMRSKFKIEDITSGETIKKFTLNINCNNCNNSKIKNTYLDLNNFFTNLKSIINIF